MKLICLGLLSALMICPLHAVEIFEMDGVTDGGGGRGVVCYDDANNVKSVELLDFYEAELLEGYNIPERSGTFSEVIQSISGKAQSHYGKNFFKNWDMLYKGFKFLRSNIRLKPVQDSGHIFDIGENCKIEQVANFQGVGRIFIVGDYWNLMSETHKAGLLMHEYIWYQERMAGAKNSARARRTVARYFSENFEFQPLGLAYRGVTCYTPNEDTRDFGGGTEFEMYFDKEEKVFKLAFETLNGAPVHTGHFATLQDYDLYHQMATPVYRDVFLEFEETFSVKNSESDMTHFINLKINFEPNGENAWKKNMFISVTNNEFPGYNTPFKKLECEKFNR